MMTVSAFIMSVAVVINVCAACASVYFAIQSWRSMREIERQVGRRK